MADVPAVSLNNGVTMPQTGFGVFRVSEADTGPAVLSAIEAGYRGIDTASWYGNETAVGRAIARCGVPREQLFITTNARESPGGPGEYKPADSADSSTSFGWRSGADGL